MLVAQSYSHRTMSSDIPHPRKRPSLRPVQKEKNEKRSDDKPKLLSAVTSPTSSKPVVIPTRTSEPKRRSRPQQSDLSKHDALAVSPSMAALLAVAAVTTTSPLSTKRSLSEKLSRKEKLSMDDFRFSLSSASPKSWSILQSPPDDDDLDKDCEEDTCSIGSESTAAVLMSCRSMSLDSMPSLDIEMDSESSASLDLPTPSPRLRSSLTKILLPRSVLDDMAHPLSPPGDFEKEMVTPTSEKKFDLHLPQSPVTPTTSLKSNLTASLRRLKSAAKSTLSTISLTQYTPNPLSSFAAPANPLGNGTSSRPLVLGNIDALPLHLTSPLPDLPTSSTSIQLVSWVSSAVPSSSKATAPPVFLPAASPSHETLKHNLLPRPREPRENGDFLRIVVMEMNMRRAGKLNSEGRARIWLSARRDTRLENESRGDSSEGQQRGTPDRWTSITA